MKYLISLAAQRLPSNRARLIVFSLAFQIAFFGRVLAADDSAEFPITIYPDLIYVPVTIGTSEHLCVVDSGAGASIFHTTLRQKLGPLVGFTIITSGDGSISLAEQFKGP